MGFTRNFWIVGNLSLVESKFPEFSKRCKELCRDISKHYGGSISGPHGFGEPSFLEHVVAFNGSDDDSCETFSIHIKDEGFQFCKTNRKPYDRHVLGSLILATKFFGDNIKFRLEDQGGDSEMLDFVAKFIRDKKINEIIDV